MLDGLNRRLRKTVALSGDLDQDTRYYYSGWRCLQERTVTDDDPEDWAELLAKEYTWGGRYLDELVSYARDTSTTPDGALDKTWYAHQDALYNVVALVLDDAGDSANDGLVQERYEYDAYGRVTIFDKNDLPLQKSVLGLEFLFTGQRRDNETGLMYYKNRYYDPATGRFISHDPVGYHDGHNLLQYVRGMPDRHTDSLGLGTGLLCSCTDNDIQRDNAGYEACTSNVEAAYEMCQNAANKAYDLTMETIDQETAKLLAECAASCRSTNPWWQRTCTFACQNGIRASAKLNRTAAFATYQGLTAGCLASKGLGYIKCYTGFPCHGKQPVGDPEDYGYTKVWHDPLLGDFYVDDWLLEP